MKKLNIAVLLFGAFLFVGCAATSSNGGMKAGAGKCGSSTEKPAGKCGGDKASKCGTAKKCS